MALASINIATIYSSAQCVLSVIGSVGVILLFAGIPQLIYSSVISVANLLTFILGAVLITTMVAGNSILNYKYRNYARSQENASESGDGGGGAAEDDKPPSYDTILQSDGLPPNYYSVVSEKPPRYEDIAVFTIDSIAPSVPAPSLTAPSIAPHPDQGLTQLSVPQHSLDVLHTNAEVYADGLLKGVLLDHRETGPVLVSQAKDVSIKSEASDDLGHENPSYVIGEVENSRNPDINESES